tara:strand:+ start:45 stop:677 length:633 start_codon:yes stop_codon:yes gene_type:complete
MISLSLDTCNKKTSICLKKNDSYLTETIDSNTPNHCEILVPMIQEILKSNNNNISDINEVRVNTGPGNLVSLRIGITVANILSKSLKIPVIGIPSFYAHNSCNDIYDHSVIIAINIRNGLYAYAKFDSNSMEILDYSFKSDQDKINKIISRNHKLISDSLIDDFLISKGFCHNDISAYNIAKLEPSNLMNLLQKNIPIRPINEYSFVVNN